MILIFNFDSLFLFCVAKRSSFVVEIFFFFLDFAHIYMKIWGPNNWDHRNKVCPKGYIWDLQVLKRKNRGEIVYFLGLLGPPPQNIFVIISEIFLFFLTTNLSEYRGLKIKKVIFFFFILLNSIFFFSVNTVKIKLLKKSKIFYRTLIFTEGS